MAGGAPESGSLQDGWTSRRNPLQLEDGSTLIVESTLSPIHDAERRAVGYVLACRDITKPFELEQQLQRLSLAVEKSASGIFITDGDGVIEYVNPGFEHISGYGAEDAIGRTPRILQSGQTPPEVYRHLWAGIKAGQPWRGQLLNRHKSGKLYWCMQTISVITDRDGRITNFVAVSEDVSERKAAEETIHRLAYYDALTDLPNRRMFLDRAEDQVRLCKRTGRRFALFYIDLDRFKDINDSLGHDIGDKLLIQAGRRVRDILREIDYVGRLGGDEFSALVVEVDDPNVLAHVAERLIAGIEKVFRIDDHELFLSTSIGIALYPDNGADVPTLIKHADMALYRAKARGKRTYEFFSQALEESNRHRLGVERDLRGAIERGEFFLEYQPKVDAATHRVVGAEALLRWNHPERGRLPPDQFIPIAEESRLIIPIGRWVIEEACRQLAEWARLGHPPLQMAVDLSAVQFQTEGLAENIGDILRRHRIDPRQLQLEITETFLMDRPEQAVELLRRMTAIGLSVAIDDFGTGYSSLSYLKRFPVSVLKIDRSFVRDLSNDADDCAIAAAIIGMAQTLSMQVVAEGVETADQRDLLEHMRCDILQGYLFSKPLGATDFAAYLRKQAQSPRAARSAA